MAKEPETKKQPIETPLTPYQERQMKDLALDKRLFKGENAIDLRVLDRLHRTKKLKDNAAKYSGTPSDLNDPYYHYIHTLRKGHFTKRGLKSLRFLEALEKGEHEKAKAQEILKKIFKSESPLSEKAEEAFIAELDRARAEDFIENPDAMMDKTKDVARAITTETDRTDIKTRITAVTEDTDGRTLFELGPYKVQCPDRLLVQRLNAFAEEYKTLSEVYKEIFEEWDTLTDKLVAGVSDEEKKRIEDRLDAIGKVKYNIEKRMYEIKKESEKDRGEFLTWVKKHMERYRSLNKFERASGIDITSGKDLKKWRLDIEYTSKGGVDASSIGGLEADEKTGAVKRREGVIHIEDVYFEDEVDEEDPEANTANTEFPGKLMVKYREDDNPNVIEASYINFCHKLDLLGAYEDIKTIAEAESALELKRPLKKGDVFKAKVVTEKQDGTEESSELEFKIEDLINERGNQFIVLDRPVKVLDKNQVPVSAHPALYFDRYAKKFSPGEFVKLVRHKYTRDDEKPVNMWKMPKTDPVEEGGKTPEEIEAMRQAAQYPEEAFTDEYVIQHMPGARGDYRRVAVDVVNKNPAAPAAPTAPGAPAAPGTPTAAPPTAPTSPTSGPVPGAPGSVPSTPSATTSTVAPVPVPIPTEGPEHPESTEFPEPSEMPEEPDVPGAPHNTSHAQDTKSDKDMEKSFTEEKPHTGEALPYEEVYKVGGMKAKQESYLRALWRDTRVLSFDDFWNWGKAMYEYYQRRWERYQKEKYAKVGKNLPYFAPEMERIHQAAENEEVHHFKEAFDLKGIYFIEDRLNKTDNQDELKACIEVLVDKGEWRLDNIHFWENLNKFVSAEHAIPIPKNGDPYTLVDAKTQKRGFDYLEPAIDSIWGEGTYAELFAKNKSNFESGCKKFYEKGNEMEGDPLGHAGRLKTLLNMHKAGLYVSPHEFEGMIRHSIDYGKSDMQTKLYYMVAGVTAKNPHGHTILSFDRIAHINSALLPKMPLLDFMTRSVPRISEDGSVKKHRYTKDDYEKWLEIFDGGDHSNSEPNKNVDDFLWKYVAVDDRMITRINKAIRNGENLDHDDMFFYFPPISEGVIDNACRSISGSKKALTQEGYANGFPGFSQYMRSLAENGHKNRLKEGIKSYMRFMGILTNRYDKDSESLARLDDNMLRDGTVVTPDVAPLAYINECNMAIKRVVAAYSDHPKYAELAEKLEKMLDWEVGDVKGDKAEREKQNQVDYAYKTFGKLFNEVVKSDNGTRMEAAILASNLYGMPDFVTASEKEQRKQQLSGRYSNDMGLEEDPDL